VRVSVLKGNFGKLSPSYRLAKIPNIFLKEMDDIEDLRDIPAGKENEKIVGNLKYNFVIIMDCFQAICQASRLSLYIDYIVMSCEERRIVEEAKVWNRALKIIIRYLEKDAFLTRE
jgi:hypothetical protein